MSRQYHPVIHETARNANREPMNPGALPRKALAKILSSFIGNASPNPSKPTIDGAARRVSGRPARPPSKCSKGGAHK